MVAVLDGELSLRCSFDFPESAVAVFGKLLGGLTRVFRGFRYHSRFHLVKVGVFVCGLIVVVSRHDCDSLFEKFGLARHQLIDRFHLCGSNNHYRGNIKGAGVELYRSACISTTCGALTEISESVIPFDFRKPTIAELVF